jgi:acarbose 7IV-phosphotransferase
MTSRELQASFDVAVIGNIGVDTSIFLHGGDIDFSVEANFTENLDCVGQAGGYASRGYARLGKRTAFLGYVGDDFGGRLIREALAADGIDTSGLLVDPAGTNRSVNVMYRDGRRKNFYDGKTHMTLRPPSDVCRAVIHASRLAHFHIPNWARQLLPIAKQHGLTVACDIQDVVTLFDGYRDDFIRAADVLFLSAVNHPDPTVLVRQCLAVNPQQIVVVGRGAQGCALGTAEGLRFFAVPELDLPVVDTNGAGDALAVGFLTSYVLDGFSLEDAVLRGQIAARYTCALRASSSDLISREELERRFARLRAPVTRPDGGV